MVVNDFFELAVAKGIAAGILGFNHSIGVKQEAVAGDCYVAQRCAELAHLLSGRDVHDDVPQTGPGGRGPSAWPSPADTASRTFERLATISAKINALGTNTCTFSGVRSVVAGRSGIQRDPGYARRRRTGAALEIPGRPWPDNGPRTGLATP